MAWGIFNDPVQSLVFAVGLVFTPICVIATALRFIASRVSLGKIGIEDWLALGALVFYITWTVITGISATYLDDMDFTKSSATSRLLPLVIATLMFAPNQLCAKLSILFLYHRIFGVKKAYSLWIKALGILQIIYTIPTMVIEALECWPVQKSRATNESCIVISAAFMARAEPVNSFVDFAMATLAIFMLRSLQTSRKTKWKLSLLFISGALAGIIGFIKAGLAFPAAYGNQIFMGVGTTVQMALSIICCCAITFRPLLTKTHLFSSLAAKILACGSRLLLVRKAFPPSSDRTSDHGINLETASGTRHPAVSNDV
ncbi:benzoate 4-monooxygenase cytochrome P450, partial [Metarhizium brunneum ARSEF 3297]